MVEDAGWRDAVQAVPLIGQGQLAIMQADQSRRSLKRVIQPGLQIAVNKELLAKQRHQIR